MFTVAVYWCESQFIPSHDDSHVIAYAETPLQMFDNEQDALKAARALVKDEHLTRTGQAKACVVRGYPVDSFAGFWDALTVGQNQEVIFVN